MEIRHNSAISKYRDPLGAVPAGTKVKLRIDLEQAGLYNDATVKAVVERNGETKSFPMKVYDEYIEGTITAPADPKLYYYYFEITEGKQVKYVGCQEETSTGECYISDQIPRGFQLTVYASGFSTPDWSKNGIMYQIFPDRFAQGDENNLIKGAQYHRNKGRRVVVHSSWNERPISKAIDGYDNYDPVDYFGGDLRGIIDKLPMLSEMGISVIYMNPIVEAASNHRYNTGDYYMVDPILGTMDDFTELCTKAHNMGIKIVLDGVYSHTGSDSKYFNKNYNYDSCGAYQGPESSYYSWYKFHGNRDDYDCWWGFQSLPEVNEFDPDWQKTVVTGKNSVIKFWLGKGADGFRLDVADELPDEVIELMRTAVKEVSSDDLLLGEVWEDATTKVSYGKQREYCMGNALDCIMNYPLRKAIIGFLMQHIHGAGFVNLLESQQNNYPKEMYYSQMNLLSSHDVARIKTVLGTDNEGDGLSRDEQGRYVMTNREDIRGRELMRLAYVLTFSLPGMPCIYYGDEQEMVGFKDPFNREPYVVKSPQMKRFISELANLRKETPALRTGACGFAYRYNNVACILRFILGGKDAFGKEEKDGVYVCVVNPTSLELKFELDIHDMVEGLSADEVKELQFFLPKSASCIKGKATVVMARDSVLLFKVPSREFGIVKVT